MTSTLIRQAGPYTVTTDGRRILVNGAQARLITPPAGSPLAWIVDSGCKGANGKRDMIGLTAEQYAIHTTAIAARVAAFAASPEGQRQALRLQLDQLLGQAEDARAANFQRGLTGGRFGVVADLTAEIAAARRALAEFDVAHPELRPQPQPAADGVARALRGED